MNTDILPADTNMGSVTLLVGRLDDMVDFYHRGVGLSVLDHGKDTATLGRSGKPLLVLQQDAVLKHAPTSSAGLFHTAFLFPKAEEVASAVYSLARLFPTAFTGSSDHGVSTAFYFDDPEGNGVELYWDLPRDEWKWQGNRVVMGTAYLDPIEFLRQHLSEDGSMSVADTPASIGHVHLKVGDLKTASTFYVDTLGFEITNEFGSQALFVSAGGYHHHLGMNTWQSRGAGQRSPALGLGEVRIHVGSSAALGAIHERLIHHRIVVAETGSEIMFDDPWKNKVRVQV